MNWLRFSELFKASLQAESPDALWVSHAHVLLTLDGLARDIDAQTAVAKDALAFVFDPGVEARANTAAALAFIDNYIDADEGKLSLPALCLGALSYFPELTARVELVYPVLAAAVLGEVPHDLAYHNNAHFKKVLLHVLRLIAVHNRLCAGMKNELSPTQISMLMACACAHDIGHEAKGNFNGQHHVTGAQELKSYGYAAPLLRDLGYSDAMCDDLRYMFLTTDVTPIDDPRSPSNQLRIAYEMHYGSSEYDDDFSLIADLKRLEENAQLCLLCMLMHEGDLMNSAGLSYETTISETLRLSHESTRISASPEDTYLFLKMVCHEEMVTDAAQFLGQDNMNDILHRVYQDIKSGVRSYAA